MKKCLIVIAAFVFVGCQTDNNCFDLTGNLSKEKCENVGFGIQYTAHQFDTGEHNTGIGYRTKLVENK